jgi:predicted metalloprotease with PDZ domain
MYNMKTRTRIAAFMLTGMLCLPGQADAQQKYRASVDLGAIENDQLQVTILVPEVEDKKALFVFPKIVPGTYDNSSFGRYVEDFNAFDAKGKKLKVKKIDTNAFRVKRANRTERVSYRINDTWDSREGRYIFQPGGTSFEENEEFVLNTFGLVGYFNAYLDDIPYELEIKHPEFLYGATSLDRISSGPGKDVFVAENYVELVDQPILYTHPDTVTYMEGGARIGIAVRSPVEEINAGVIREMLQPITQATSFVLGSIPTDEYWFLFHFFNWGDEAFSNGGGAFGALEHKKSSLYFIPTYLSENGVDMESVKGTIDDMATHEFLHILSPLNLHSEEIAYFDFYETKMSQHLWLYEGVTEYLSIKSLFLGGLIDLEEFNNKIIEKIQTAGRYRDISFTEMSKNIITDEMQREFYNVYQKGALLAMILDMKTAIVTDGEKDLIDLVLELIDEYGIGKPFKDEEFFDVITSRTAPEMRDFFRRYYEGSEELPLADLMEECGMRYTTEKSEEEYSFGKFSMDFDANSGLLNITPRDDNEIIAEPIAIARLNDEDLSFRLVRHLLLNPSTNDPLLIEYMVDGKARTMEITPELSEGALDHNIEKMDGMSERQLKLFNKLFTPGIEN